MRLLSASQRPGGTSKPCEDAFLWNKFGNTACIADGVTRTPKAGEEYPVPSPSAAAAKIAVSRASQALSETRRAPYSALRRAFFSANRDIRELAASQSKCNYLDADYPGTVMSVVKHVDDELFVGHLGDAVVAFLSESDRLEIITACQTKAVDLWASTQFEFKDAMERVKHVREFIRNNQSHPCGYGVLTGEPTALKFVRFSKHRWAKGNLLLLYSDGLSQILGGDISTRPLSPLLANYLRHGKWSELFQVADTVCEMSGTRSDDKTIGVFISD